jgi:aconitate decarboxylase
LTGVLAIIQRENIKAEQIEEVRIYVEKGRKEFFERERDKRYRPPRLADVQHSHPYLAAVLLLKGKLSIDDFTEEAIRDENVLKLAERVKVLHDPKLELDDGPMVIKPNFVEIVMKNGAIYSERVEYPKGHPNNPLTPTDKLAYFRDLTRFAVKPILPENIEKTISLVSGMENSEDISGICRLLT